MRVRAFGDARQRRARLALAAGAQQQQLVGRHALGLAFVDQGLDVGQESHRAGGRGHAMHRAADQAHLAPVGLARADGGVHARHVGGEARDRDLALQRADQPVHGHADLGFRAGAAIDEDVGGITHHRQHALVAQALDRLDVSRGAELRIGIDLPVSGVQDHAQRRADRHPIRLRNRMGYGDQFKLERPELDRAAQGHLGDLDRVFQILVAQFLADEEGGERRGVERRLQARPQPAQRPDMVLMGVGEHDAQDVLGVVLHEGRIGHDDLDAWRGGVAEGHAHIDDDPLAAIGRPVAVAIEIHTDLVGASQREEYEFVVRFSGFHLGLKRHCGARFPAGRGG